MTAHALGCGLHNSTLRSGNSRMRLGLDRVIVHCGPVIRACNCGGLPVRYIYSIVHYGSRFNLRK